MKIGLGASVLSVLLLPGIGIAFERESPQSLLERTGKVTAAVIEESTLGSVDVVVRFTSPPLTGGGGFGVNPSTSHLDTSSSIINDINSGTYVVRHQFSSFSIFSIEADALALTELANDSRVERIHIDHETIDYLPEAGTVGGFDVLHGLPVTGAGQRVAVIDSGYDREHLQLGGVVDSLEQCFGDCPYGTSGPGAAQDDHGHGTWMTGMILGTDAMAPDAEVIALRTRGATTGGTATDRLAALQWLVDNPSVDVDVVNMSFGIADPRVNQSHRAMYYTQACDCITDAPTNKGGCTNNEEDFLLGEFTELTDVLLSRDVTLVAAVGNWQSSSAPTFANKATAPACLSSVIGVGAAYDFNGVFDGSCYDANAVVGGLTCFSSHPTNLTDLLAPGAWITGPSLDPSSTPSNTQSTQEGTSQASAIVSGCVALMYELGATDPDLIREALARSPIGPDGFPVLDCGVAADWVLREESDLALQVDGPYTDECVATAQIENVGRSAMSAIEAELLFQSSGGFSFHPSTVIPPECQVGTAPACPGGCSLIECTVESLDVGEKFEFDYHLEAQSVVNIYWSLEDSKPVDGNSSNDLGTGTCTGN